MTQLHDMHCHLDFIKDASALADDARENGTLIFANTVTPQGYEKASALFWQSENVAVGFGMHPWWVGGSAKGEATDANAASSPVGLQATRADEESPKAEHPGTCDAAAKATRAESQRQADKRRAAAASCANELGQPEKEQIARTIEALACHDPRLIGEIGLDFGWRHQETRLAQTRMFEAITAWAAQRGGKVLSLHSIKAAAEALAILQASGALESCTCIFHWFSGPSDLLKRAIDAGCFFSCGQRMLATRKGREYIKAIPARQMLLETDAPPERGMSYPYVLLHRDLQAAADGIAAIKGASALEAIALSSQRILTPNP